MKKYMLWPLLAVIGGGSAFVLRLLQRGTGFEADTGLPIPGNPYAVLLAIWFVVVAAGCLLAARATLPADREDPPLFPAGFSVSSPGLLTPAVMGIFLLAASGVADLLFGVSGASALTGSGEMVTVMVTTRGSQLFSGGEHLLVGVLSLLMAVSLFPAIPACRVRPEGEARKPFQGALLLVPVCCLVVRLVLTYRAVSSDPVPHRLLPGAAGGGLSDPGLLPAVLLCLPGRADPPLRPVCRAGHRLLPGHAGRSAGHGPAACSTWAEP